MHIHKKCFFFLFVLIVAVTTTQLTAAESLAEKLEGYILLQVEQHGEAWYVRGDDLSRYYMKDGDAAYQMMRYFSLGISNADLLKVPIVKDTTEMLEKSSVCASNTLADKLKGKILLQVESVGEAYYVYPKTCRMIYMADGDAAYSIMRFLGLGIADADLAKIAEGAAEGYPGADQPSSSEPAESTSSGTALSWPADVGTTRFGRLTDYRRFGSEIEGGWVRPHSGPFVWDWTEKAEGAFYWNDADKVVESLQDDRQAILATVWGFAQWDQASCHSSSEKANDPFIRTVDWVDAPCDMDAYLNWLSLMVERYDGDGIDDMPGLAYPIRHWEIFNEPALQSQPTFFQGTTEEFVEIMQKSYDTIKAADENAVVLTGGQAGMSVDVEDYWDDVLPSINGSFDIGNIHSISASETFWSGEYRDYLDDHGYTSKEFWITEALVGDFMKNRTEDELAQLTFTGYANAFANGADKIFNVGKHDPSDPPGEASEDTFELMAETIGDFETVERLSDTSVLFTMPGGLKIYALWDFASLPSDVDGFVNVIEYDGTSYTTGSTGVNAAVPLFVLDI